MTSWHFGSLDQRKTNMNTDANELDELDMDNILLNIDPDSASLADLTSEFEDDYSLPRTAMQEFEEKYTEYNRKFGETFDPYLVTRNTDEFMKMTIEKMQESIGSGKPLRPKDLGLPEYQKPVDEFDIQVSI